MDPVSPAPFKFKFFLHQIVYIEPEVSEKLLKYKAELESYGALVKLVHTGQMKCVLKAQIIRVLAFLLPEVNTLLFRARS